MCVISDNAKTVCGDTGINESDCLHQGCCWLQASGTSPSACVNAAPDGEGYNLVTMTETTNGFTGILSLAQGSTSGYGPDIKLLKLDVTFETNDIVRVKVTDAEKTRWEIPQTMVERTSASSKPSSIAYSF